MQTATSETKSKFLDLSICVHHYTLRAPCPKGQGIAVFPILADAVDVKKGDQLCETVPEPSIQPDKVIKPMSG